MAYTNSSLVNYKQLSPNHSGRRTYPITRITPHCVVGQASVETIGKIFASTSRQASCQYGIGSDGRVALICEERFRSWCTGGYLDFIANGKTRSGSLNDQKAVTIECASDASAPYAFNSTVYNKLIDLCVDICKRNGKNKLMWISDKVKAEIYSDKQPSNEMLLTVHCWYAAKSCPGQWLLNRMADLAQKVNVKLGSVGVVTNPQTAEKVTTVTAFPTVPFLVSVLIDNLNIRTGAGNNYSVTGKYTGKGDFTIVEVKDGWGKLKSVAGWIYLGNPSYVKVGKTVVAEKTKVKFDPSKVADAKNKNTTYNGKYIVTADALNLRYAPNGEIIVAMPKNTTVYNYGWFTQDGNTTWLCVQAMVNGVSYSGYCGKGYLKKV